MQQRNEPSQSKPTALPDSPRGSKPSQSAPVGRVQIPLFVTYSDIFPRSGGSLSSQGELFGTFRQVEQNLPLRGRWHRVAMTERVRFPRSAALSQKAALQMPLPITTPPVKMQSRSVRRRSGFALLKIIFPLFMRRAARRAFQIVPLPASHFSASASLHSTQCRGRNSRHAGGAAV